MISLYRFCLMLFLTAPLFVFAQTSTFRVSLFVQTGESYASQHYFGVSPQNTIGLDTNRNLGDFREVLLPPQPPTYPFSSRFRTIPGRPATPIAGLGNGVHNDFRGFVDSVQVDTFKIEITGDSLETHETTISWSTDLSQYASEWTIKPQTGSDFPETNMLTSSFVIFPKGPVSRSALIIKKGARLTTGIHDQPVAVPEHFALGQNFPNPFNPTTSIQYQVPTTGNVSIIVYDILGKEITTLVHRVHAPGYYTVQFSLPSLSSGIYFYRMASADFISVKRMIILK